MDDSTTTLAAQNALVQLEQAPLARVQVNRGVPVAGGVLRGHLALSPGIQTGQWSCTQVDISLQLHECFRTSVSDELIDLKDVKGEAQVVDSVTVALAGMTQTSWALSIPLLSPPSLCLFELELRWSVLFEFHVGLGAGEVRKLHWQLPLEVLPAGPTSRPPAFTVPSCRRMHVIVDSPVNG